MKKIILSALACTALLTGCVSQDKGNAMQSQLNNQQRQINELSVRLQSAESRLSKQEEKLRNELLQSSGYCYLNGARYSTGDRTLRADLPESVRQRFVAGIQPSLNTRAV